MAYDWSRMLSQLDNPDEAFAQYEEGISPPWHYKNHPSKSRPTSQIINSKDLYHVVIIAVSNETIDIVGPTIETLTKSVYDQSKMIVIAYEQQGGVAVAEMVKVLEKQYNKVFIA